MPLLRITSEERRLNKLVADLDKGVIDADLGLQHVFSSYLVLAGAGHIENSVIHILSEYGRTHGNSAVKRFIEKTIARNNSLNCEKIKIILDQFDVTWWSLLEAATLESEREAVDSLKTLRDQIAHGHRNGTGFSVVNGYFDSAKSFIQKFSTVVLGH